MATTTQYATATSYSIYDHSPIKENTFEKILNDKLMNEVKSPDNLTKEAAIQRAQSQHVSAKAHAFCLVTQTQEDCFSFGCSRYASREEGEQEEELRRILGKTGKR